MCGIFGAVIATDSELRKSGEETLERLFLLSESRGKEAAGVAFAAPRELFVVKGAIPASQFIRTRNYKDAAKDAIKEDSALAFIGHSRLVTDGAREVSFNNQPVIANGVVGIHNGIIVNHAAVWSKHSDLVRKFDVDSEVIFALMRKYLDLGLDTSAATAKTFAELEGAASVAALFSDRDELLLATNNGSLYYRMSADGSALVFASESYILAQVEGLEKTPIVHVEPWSGARISLKNLALHRFKFVEPNGAMDVARPSWRSVVDRSASGETSGPLRPPRTDLSNVYARFPHRSIGDRVRRCSRCVLPNTMPYIAFDEAGVCSYCRNYQKNTPAGPEALEKLVAPYRRNDGRPDCVVGLSGGRDSTYGLWFIKKVLGLNPVAFTYDWGMVTDLARRNISRICGKMGIEHILVSADIIEKRKFIRENVEAWLAKPSLGTIPLFMAGDKAYFHYLGKVSKDTGAPLMFLCENLLERTDFKSGFAGVPPAFFDKDHVYTMSVLNKGRMLGYYGKEFLKNPKYLNSSLIDSAKAFAYYYLTDRDYHNLYRYIEWNEETIRKVLVEELDFELAPDTDSFWRIGDGTAAFYNYIYYSVAGFTENDTFRSNQIREGVMDRERALRLIETENRPRFPTIQWYLETIGLDRSLEDVLETIERIPKLNALIGELYGADALGVFNQVFAIYIFTSQLAVLGMHQSALKHVAEHRANAKVVANAAVHATIPLALCVSALVWLGAPLFGDFVQSEAVAIGTRWVAPGLFFFALNKVLLGVLNALEHMRAYAILQAARFLFMLLGFFVCRELDLPLALILTIGEAGTFLGALFATRGFLAPTADRVWAKEHLRFGIRGFMSGVFVELNTRVDVLLLGYFATDAVVGAYSFAAIFAEAFLQLLIVLRAQYNPRLVRFLAEQDYSGLSNSVRSARGKIYLGFAALGLFAVLFYTFVFPLVLSDPRLAGSWPIFAILVAGIVLSSGYTPFNQLPMLAGHPGWQTILLSVTVAINIAGNLFLIPMYGAEGSAAATALANVLQTVLLVILVRRLIGAKI